MTRTRTHGTSSLLQLLEERQRFLVSVLENTRNAIGKAESAIRESSALLSAICQHSGPPEIKIRRADNTTYTMPGLVSGFLPTMKRTRNSTKGSMTGRTTPHTKR